MPHGMRTMISGSQWATSSQPTTVDGRASRPRPSTPPASRTISGTQWPALKGGSSHSIANTRGRAVAARARAATLSKRERSPATTARARSSTPAAPPTCSIVSRTPPRLVGSSERIVGRPASRPAAFRTSREETAQTSHSSCVRIRSGSSRSRVASSRA